MKFLIIFSLLLLTPFIASAKVEINEIAWMGTTNSTYDEWIELYNSGEEDINLFYYQLGWSDKLIAFNNTETNTKEINNVIIPAKGYFLLERTDDNSVPEQLADIIYTGGLVDDGETLELRDDEGNLIDQINCSEEWPHGDKITKQTMERITDDWQTSLDPNGTPKSANSSGAVEEPKDEPEEEPSPEEPEVEASPTESSTYTPIANAGNDIIGFIDQEISFDSASSSDPNGYELAYSWNMGNGELIEKDVFTYVFNYPGTYLVTLMVYNGRTYAWDTITVEIKNQNISINEFVPNQWIELYNNSNSVIDLSNWQLQGNNTFVFPQHTLIAPKNYLVFSESIIDLKASNSIKLLLPEGIVFQEINYENAKPNQSSAKTEQGFVWTTPTPGTTNMSLVGGEQKETIYLGETSIETTKELPQEYVYVPLKQEPIPLAVIPEQENLAMVTIEAENNKSTLNLILMLVAVILGSSLIGIIITRFIKKPNT